MQIAEGDDACVEHDWVTDEKVLASDESHIVKVCRNCSAVALIGPDNLTGWA